MIYFLYGEDSYRSRQKLYEIVEGYKKAHKSGLNLIYVDAKEKDFGDFFDNFRTASMFAEKKLIILKNIFANPNFQKDFLNKSDDVKKNQDIVVVYEDDAADQRTKFFKTLQKHAKCQEFKFLQPVQLKNWVLAEFSKKNSNIDFAAESLLSGFVGNNLWQMANEINKLVNYKKNSVITRQDVELLVRPNIENDIFKTIDAMASKNKKQAIGLLHKHIDSGEPPLRLLSMIAYQFRNLLIIKELQETKSSYAVIVKKSGLHPFVVKKSYYLCNQFLMPELKKIYRKIFQIDLDIKTGKIDAETALDMLVASI